MENIDLDINNYTINDIEKFFKLKPKSGYTAVDVELREAQIREQLLSSGHIDKRLKRDLIEFLTSAKEWLMDIKCPPQKQPSIIPKNAQLDKTDFPASRIPPSREGELIERKNIQYVISHPSEFVPGEINPLKTRVISKCLTIDTRFRDNFYTTPSSDFTFQMPVKLNKVVSMQMSAFEIPVAFYGISSTYGNNFLWIKITYPNPGYDDEPVEEEKILIIPDGNYNAQDFIDTINELLSPKKIDGTLENPDNMFSYVRFTLDIKESGSGTGKVTLETYGTKCKDISKIELDFSRSIDGTPDLIDISTKIGWNLGFTKKKYENKKSYVAETLIEPASIRYIYLAIDDFNNSVNNHFITAFNQSILNPNILARISIKGTYFSLLMENDLNIVTEPRKYFGPVDIQRLRVRLYDDHGRILEMNNANFSFCLVFKLLYDL
jgi:hypothetical protein